MSKSWFMTGTGNEYAGYLENLTEVNAILDYKSYGNHGNLAAIFITEDDVPIFLIAWDRKKFKELDSFEEGSILKLKFRLNEKEGHIYSKIVKEAA